MIIEHYLIDQTQGYQVKFQNPTTGKTLYLICHINIDLEQFKANNLPIAIEETA